MLFGFWVFPDCTFLDISIWQGSIQHIKWVKSYSNEAFSFNHCIERWKSLKTFYEANHKM